MNMLVKISDADIEQARQEKGWSDLRTRVAMTLYASGKSDAYIAGLLGGGLSRNAVIGKRNRLGVRVGVNPALDQRPRLKFSNGRRAGDPKPARPAAATTVAVSKPKRSEPPAHVDDLAIPLEQRRSLFALDSRCCRWPVGDPQDSSFFFCGAPKADDAQPYCKPHAWRAGQH